MSGLETQSDSELVQAWIDNVREHDAIEHVGAANRHFGERMKIVDELMARSDGRLNLMLPLLEHSDLDVRYTAAFLFREADPTVFRKTLAGLSTMGGKVAADAARMLAAPPLAKSVPQPPIPEDHPLFWAARNPPAPSMPRDEVERRLSSLFPAEHKKLLSLLTPAIGLWPQPAEASAPIAGSRLGGMPYAPPGWTWPVEEGEPMLFIGQINCADVRHLPGADVLPSDGVLAFFGDHDAVQGCTFAMGGAVFHWPETSEWTPAVPPLEILTVFPRAELLFRPTLEMPDPKSEALASVLKDNGQREVYREFHAALQSYGMPDGYEYTVDFGSMLGWPRLVQHAELELFDVDPEDARVLLQIGSYTNGREFGDWGPGGSIYFVTSNSALAERDWESCELTGQFT